MKRAIPITVFLTGWTFFILPIPLFRFAIHFLLSYHIFTEKALQKDYKNPSKIARQQVLAVYEERIFIQATARPQGVLSYSQGIAGSMAEILPHKPVRVRVLPPFCNIY
jgi:hypothetical protein